MEITSQYDKWTEFLTEYAQYFVSNEDVWIQNFEPTKEYTTKHNKLPSIRDKDPVIKKLGQWVSTQQNNYKNKQQSMAIKSQYDKWTEFLTEYAQYFMTDEDKWNQQYEQFKSYITENKKLPSQKDKDSKIKKLGAWCSHQQTNYKKKQYSMAIQSQYDKWTDMRIIIANLQNEIIPPPKPTLNTTPKIKIKSMNLPIVPTTTTDSVAIPSTVESKESTITKQARQKSQMSVLHQQYKTLKSTNLQQLFQDKPKLFHEYHDLSEANESSFPTDEIPRNRIIQKLESIKVAKNKSKTVVDMGCGKAHIAEHFKNDARYTFINYDHISSRTDIEKCDISQTPLDDNEVEIAVLCLAMWGSNCRYYITEAHRILETGGRLYIIEATKRWSKNDESNNIVAGQEGGKLRTLLEEAGFQILDADIRKFSQFVCVKT
jgi:ubiquinone/menaquinone biosynthesis C-methylase UbiE